MKYKKTIIPFLIILIVGVSVFIWYKNNIYSNVIKFFPINNSIYFTEVGSDLEIYEQENKRYKVVGESWSQTSEKVFLRQDVNLLFQNGFLKGFDYPWEKDTDWIINKIAIPLEMDSIYSLLSYHHAEIHQNDIITSNQAVTEDKLYVSAIQNTWDAFKVPQNDLQKKQQATLTANYKKVREELLEQGLKQLNINKDNYMIYDLDTFSLKGEESGIINETQWQSVLGGLWEGLYNNYIFSYIKDELKYFSPPMPWILVDKLGTHLLVIYQQANGEFVKLIMAIK